MWTCNCCRPSKQLSQAHASLVQLRTNLKMQELQQRATTATVRADYLEAERTHRINQQLFDENPDLVAAGRPRPVTRVGGSPSASPRDRGGAAWT